MRFVVEVTPTSGNETIPNTYERLLDLNNHVDTFITLSSIFKTLEESSPLLYGHNKAGTRNQLVC